MIDYNKLKELVEKNNSFLLTTHINPDADALGSELALAYILKKLNKKVSVFNHNATPYNLEFLDSLKLIKEFNPSTDENIFNEHDVLIALDFNHSGRIKSMTEGFNKSNKTKICIDHHTNPEQFVDYYFTDDRMTSTGEIIYRFIKETNIVELDYDIALQIYAAVVTDTGSFKYDRTTPETHLMAAELLNQGVKPYKVLDKLYDQSKVSKLKVLGECLSNIYLTPSGNVAALKITQDMLNRTGAEESEIDGFVNFGLSIQGTKIALLIFELADGVKISFRSKDSVPVNKLAAEYGGGGHVNASGARVYECSLDDISNEIIDRAEFYSTIEEAK